MLIYHPAFDAYHSMFRLLAVIEKKPNVEIDKARILEFLLLFPATIAIIRNPVGAGVAKNAAKKIANPYHDPINPRTTFREMRFMQDAAMKCIAAADIIDKERLEQGFLTRTQKPIPESLKGAVELFLDERGSIADYVFDVLAEMSLLGANGLKDRTNLMEYRYDYVS